MAVSGDRLWQVEVQKHGLRQRAILMVWFSAAPDGSHQVSAIKLPMKFNDAPKEIRIPDPRFVLRGQSGSG
jgi:hypothetical protein